MGLIYLVTNKINGKHYVGQTIQKWPKRKNEHITNGKKCSAIDCAIKKYGESNFLWKVIEDDISDQTILNHLERLHISRYESSVDEWGYNIREGGNGTGKIHESTRKKMSDARKGKYCGKNSFNYGKHLSEEHRKKISESNKGKKRSEETRKKLSEALKGRKLPEEVCKRRRGVNSHFYGTHHSLETRKKISDSNKGRIISEEHRKIVAEANRQRIISKETRKKISDSNKGKYPGTRYTCKNINPWKRVWQSRISYNNHRVSLGFFNDPITSSIIYNLVWNEIYNGNDKGES